MVKEYFGHDYNARHDIKMVALRAETGVSGYGAYWLLVEELYCNGNALPLSMLGSLAKAYRCPASLLYRVVREFGLFVVDEEAGTFSSDRIARTLDERARVADSRKDAASRRWVGKGRGDGGAAARGEAAAERAQCKCNASAMQNDAKRNIKGKEDDGVVADARAGGVEAPTPAVPAAAGGGGADAIGAEVRRLLRNDSVRYQIQQKSGMGDLPAIDAYVTEFAGQLALEGKDDEHDMRLAMHFAYWLAKKMDKQHRTNGQSNLQEQKADKMRRDIEQIRAFARTGQLPGC